MVETNTGRWTSEAIDRSPVACYIPKIEPFIEFPIRIFGLRGLVFA